VRLSIFAIFLLLAICRRAVPLLWRSKDGGTLEYVCEADEQSGANAATKEKVAEIAAEVIRTFLPPQRQRT
jgi:hypothetical protein